MASASSKVRAAYDAAGGRKSQEASRAAAHKVGKREELSPHTVRSLLSRWNRGETVRKTSKAAKRPTRVAKKTTAKRPVRVAKKATRVAKKAAAAE